MNIEQLVRNGSGGVFQFAAGAVPRLSETMPLQIVDSRAVTDKASFLRDTATAMRFPDYFGHNWDAFLDCLSDASERFDRGLSVIINDLSRFAGNQPEDFDTAIATMHDAVTYWHGKGKQLLILIGLSDPKLAAKLPRINPG